ncbi:hypothetical protein C9I56_34085 [Paraburkholderia caribensis]|nr:hypothetical protein C9I56_34085 [Paraburkholderia caribensis]
MNLDRFAMLGVATMRIRPKSWRIPTSTYVDAVIEQTRIAHSTRGNAQMQQFGEIDDDSD